MCGGNLQVEKGKTVGICDSCGTQQTLPRLDDDKRAQMYDRANHFRRNNDYDKASGIYENILNEDSTDAEAYWSLVLCKYGIEYVEDFKLRKRIPTCNRAQMTSILSDEDYKQALANADSNQRIIYEEEAHIIDKIQKGILEISNLEEPFDVFICYKETDERGQRTRESVMAQEIYQELTQEGFKVFFSRITLENVLGTAYEPYIFAALNSSKVMVVVGTKPENFSAVWVKNEWSRYIALIKSGEKKVLIPAYRDMDVYDLPDEFSHLQALDMNKLGFMQDLVRGIKKIIGIGNPKAVTMETISAVSNMGVDGSLDTLMKRAFIFLEDGDFLRSKEYFNRVLDADPENARAYIGLLCIEFNLKKEENLQDCTPEVAKSLNFEKALRFASKDYKQILMSYIKDMQLNLATEKTKNSASFMEAAEILAPLKGFKNSDELLRNMEDKIKIMTQTAFNSSDFQEIYDTIDQLKSVGSFGEALQNAEQLTEHVNTIVAQKIERANKLYENNSLPDIEEAINLISPFVQRFDDASALMLKLTTANVALENSIKKVNRKKKRKSVRRIAMGFVLLLFVITWMSTRGFASQRYQDVIDIGNGLLKVESDYYEYGIINMFGVEILPCDYREISSFSDGLARVEKGMKSGLINTSGKAVVPCVYDNIDNKFHDGLARVEKDNKYGFVNKSGKEVVPCVYDSVFDFYNGIAFVEKDNKHGIVNKFGEEVVPCVYTSLNNFSDGLARVQKDGKYGFIDESGKEVVPLVYFRAEDFCDGMAVVIKDGKCGGINTSGEEVIPLAYNDITFAWDNLVLVKKDEKYGYFNRSGEEVLPIVYDHIYIFAEDLALVVKDGKYGYANTSGKIVISLVYDYAEAFKGGLAYVKKDGKNGYIDTSGKAVVK